MTPWLIALLLVAAAVSGSAVGVWLKFRRDFEDRSFGRFFEFAREYISNKWRKKPDFWSILRQLIRFALERRLNLRLAAQARAERERSERRRAKLHETLRPWFGTTLEELWHREAWEPTGFLFWGGASSLEKAAQTEGLELFEAGSPEAGIRGTRNVLWIETPPANWNDLKASLPSCELVRLPSAPQHAIALLDSAGFAPLTGNRPEFYFKAHAVSMATLGTYGQFGNQLIQYAFLRAYARRFHARPQSPAWVGQLLFGLSDAAPNPDLPRVEEWKMPQSFEHRTEPLLDRDLAGYFQYGTAFYRPEREFIRSLYRPVEKVRERLQPGLDRLRASAQTVVGLHLRASTWDCGHSVFFIAPPEWYLAWLREIWPTLERPALFVATDVPEKILPHFEEFKPFTSKTLGASLPEAAFYPDFYFLTRCDWLAISNSTFSFTASLLADRGHGFMRPDKVLKKLVPYDPWDSLPLLQQRCEDPEEVAAPGGMV
ncbi:MAG: alpha-1,2-fucosyltransferase [Verrucomicrobiae bacterium]|nr:alpha-1,2-fucosyltransferase [Verrucomicrobiae bacterium]